MSIEYSFLPAPTPEDVLQLVERCRNGDLSAFDEIVALHQNRIYNLCFWSLGDADEAADATQETFLRAWRAIAKFRGESAFATWLHRIALNVTHDAGRRRSRAPLPFSATILLKTKSYPASTHLIPALGPAQTAAQHERRLAVRRALASLPDKSPHGAGALRYRRLLLRRSGGPAATADGHFKKPPQPGARRVARALGDCRELFEEGASPTF
jgi:RNA polymerase sigma factor (sigma-70 family)